MSTTGGRCSGGQGWLLLSVIVPGAEPGPGCWYIVGISCQLRSAVAAAS